ncbi:MAG: hypothetical protein FWD69_02055 [Polyangiaceae bacterium]|nr:hypothetical protein [Polyangiaceae bacterium]
MTHNRRFLGAPIATLLSLSVVCATNTAFAQDTAIAETLYEEGQRLIQEGKTEEACDKFAASHRIDPAPGTILNLAACHETLGKSASAWAEYKEAQALAGRSGDRRREEYAARRGDALEKKIRRVMIIVGAPLQNMAVTLDDRVLERGAWGAGLALDPGLHTIEATAPGYLTWKTELTIPDRPGIDRVQIPALEPLPKTPAPSATAQHEQPTTKRAIGYGVVGAGVVSLGASVFFGLRMRSFAKDRDAACATGTPCFDQAAFNADHNARVNQQWMFITAGAGVVLGGLGAWLVLSSKSAPSTHVAVVPHADPSGGGVQVLGRF